MKKYLKGLMCFVLIGIMALCFTACGEKKYGEVDQAKGKYKDGEYKATAGDYDDQGYKSTVEVVVKDGKVYSVDCDADHKEDGTKKAHSESGKYNMKAGGAKADWHEEIAFFERHVVEKGVEDIKLDTYGKTDTITGCTISVSEYVKLINEALEKAKA